MNLIVSRRDTKVSMWFACKVAEAQYCYHHNQTCGGEERAGHAAITLCACRKFAWPYKDVGMCVCLYVWLRKGLLQGKYLRPSMTSASS